MRKYYLAVLLLPALLYSGERRLGTCTGILQHWRKDVTVEDIRALGRSNIQNFEAEPWNLKPERMDLRREFVKMLKETGKKAQSYHLPFGDEYDISQIPETARKAAIAKLLPYFDIAEEFGCEYLTIHGSNGNLPEEEDDPVRQARFANLRKSMLELEPVLRQKNLKLAVELCPYSNLGNRPAALLKLLDGMPDIYGAVVDTNHSVGKGYRAQPEESIRMLKDRVFGLHISDNDGEDEKHWMPGEGPVNFDEVKKALDEIGYKGYYTYEADVPGNEIQDRIKALEENFSFIFLED